MFKRLFFCILIIGGLLALPFFFRREDKAAETVVSDGTCDRIVIISAHNKALRDEYELAFRQYYKKRFNRDIELDFRTPGGTRDIVRYIADRFEAEFRKYYQSNPENGEWNAVTAAAFADPSVDRNPKAPAEAKRARKMFLESDVGIGIDIMAGGGTFEMVRNASRGFAADAGVQKRHPEYFSPDSIPEQFGGDRLYDKNGLWYGVVLSTFGICCNTDRINEMHDRSLPQTWGDLADMRFLGLLSVADPSKSGSANKCFEILIQQYMAQSGSPEKGWEDALNVIKRIFANARSVTESASQVVRDVTTGNAAAGMAIDTYALSQVHWARKMYGQKDMIRYITPKGGTAVSADPVQMLRGAPNRKQAEAFIDFLLSEEGQKLHCFKVSAPGGPQKYPVNRPAVRKELYDPKYDSLRFEKDYDPYVSGSDFVYRPQLTSRYFSLISRVLKALMLEPHDELSTAWQAIVAAGGPDKVPQAMAAFNALPFSYKDIGKANAALKVRPGNSAKDVAATLRNWSSFARKNYIRAAELARKGL